MKKKYLIKKLSHSEWLDAKMKTIGGSEAAAVVNKSKWVSLDDLYNKFIYGKVKRVANNERMVEGTIAEKNIRNLFALDFGKRFEVINPPARKQWFFYRVDKPYISCTPDGLLVNKKTNRPWVLEIKDVELRTREDREMWESDLLPDQYYFQNLQSMVVMEELEGAVLFAHLKYFKHNDQTDEWEFDYAVDRPYFIYRDSVSAHIEYLEKRETDFYENNVKVRKRPKLVISLK